MMYIIEVKYRKIIHIQKIYSVLPRSGNIVYLCGKSTEYGLRKEDTCRFGLSVALDDESA